MTPANWAKHLLERHNIPWADGRSLYRYHVTDSEFYELTKLLKLSSIMDIQHITSISKWDACFVMYASEWWRRHYIGKWGWDGIFESIGISNDELPISHRNRLIESGLRLWKREIRRNQNGKRQFLGTIATEGGLPLNQLKSSGGWLAKILGAVVKKHLSKGLSLSTLLENYQDDIPSSYYSEELLHVLEDIAQSVVSLRQEHKLEEKPEPIKWLNNNNPQWREIFSLPIDNEVARSLLGDLISTAAKEKQTQQSGFTAEYQLTQINTDCPKLLLHIDAPTFIFFEDSQTDTRDYPFNLDIEINIGNQQFSYRGIRTNYQGKTAIRVLGKSIKLKQFDTEECPYAQIKSMGKSLSTIPIIGGISLDKELPWIFRKIDERWVLSGTNSYSTKDTEVLVYLSDNYDYQSLDNNLSFEPIAEFYDGIIFKLSGSISCHSGDDRFKISSCDNTQTVPYQLTGKMLDYYSIPSEIFIGTPSLRKENIAIQSFSKNHTNLLAKPTGVKTDWQPIKHIQPGVYETYLFDKDQNIKFKKRIGLLSQNFNISLKPDGKNTKKGKIELKGLSGFEARINNQQVDTSITTHHDCITLSLSSQQTPPKDIDLLLQPKQGRELQIRIPFPSKGALLFNPNGEQIDFSTPLFSGDLMGYRLRILDSSNTRSRKATLLFELIDNQIDYSYLNDLYIQKMIYLEGQINEFSVYDWTQAIHELLNISLSPDAQIKISLQTAGQTYFQLYIRQFDSLIHADYEKGTIELSPRAHNRLSSDEVAKIQVHALYLQQPAQANVVLSQQYSDQAALGKWDFHPEKRQQGSWILYPPPSSSSLFRPILWNLGEICDALEETNSLGKATSIHEPELRKQAIKKLLDSMANDFNHKGWHYLLDLWDKTDHLPIETFDIWKISVSIPEFLVALFIQGHDDILLKIDQELPLVWEIIPLSIWKNSFISWRDKKLLPLFDNEDKDVRELIEIKLRKISQLTSSLLGVESILLYELFSIKSPEFDAIEHIIKKRMNEDIQILLRNKANEDWPEQLSKQIAKYLKQSICISLLNPPNYFQRAVIQLPAALAENIVSGTPLLDSAPSVTDIFKLKQLKAFDQEWFENTFQLLTVWLYQRSQQQGLLHVG